jgi:hypothetical protein
VPSLALQVVDVGPERLGDAQSVEGQQRRQGVVPGRPEVGLGEEGAQLVAVEAERVGLVVDPRAAYVGGRVALDEPLLLAVAVKLARVDRRRATVERILPFSSIHRPNSSRCGRRIPKSSRFASAHQAAKMRRSVA